MSDHEEAVANARRQALLMHAVDVHREEFNASLFRARAADRSDPFPEENAKQQETVVADRRKSLGRLARNNGTTPQKALADGTEPWSAELKNLLASWEAELAVVLDMIADPDAYGHKLLDGRPMDVKQLGEQGVPALKSAIAHARQHLGIEDEPKGGKRAQRAPTS